MFLTNYYKVTEKISEKIVTVGPGELDLDLKKILRIGKVFACKDVLCMSYIYLLYCSVDYQILSVKTEERHGLIMD